DTLNNVLKHLKGLHSVEGNLLNKELNVTYDKSIISDEEIREIIVKTGHVIE
ncbi:hypothetical protein GTO36_01690, partial [bacterium]|nr:hypothetical protein [bacterium]